MPPASRSRGRPSRDRPPPNRPPSGQRRTSRPAQPRGGRGQRPPRRRSDLLARVLVAVPAAVVAIVFVDLGGTAWALFMLAISWVCLHELYRMLPRWKPTPVVGFAAAAGLVLSARFGSERDVLEIAMASIPVTFLAVVARGGEGTPSVSIAGTLLGIFWLGLAFAHAVLLRQLDNGSGILIDILVGTFLGDTAAYLGGRLFGRRLLAPSISPNKTWEGLFCGMLITILAVFIAGLQQTWLTQGDALLLGVVVAVIGPIGDLFESLIKRDAGIKDAGNVFGAHGGALDRLDAVIFTVVAGYYVWVSLPH
ncbi:MAG TPA: phosphatidate cytidylyltransferase [Solirubrobacteraceae bacterium]|nr:phosphatidate cytidylyltransferase [Solirubrobacteraceae bacterium]